ncbi:M81 family metallopeptidase [Agriterribacter sp.]|uniref:M81 family metallopeptidase n=1 Tax=Agriterribacter sp. TaxID=2821509 RepID=UPI002CF2A34D|nr:M81 family metallopeptidase [Agriterribacter sp.]HRO45984.1 M81 family metallopeptidase [Agriterribacter sp.]HRQ17021.1 M81 family metallopeptidase [Agriterribacter sp.]
MMTVPARFTCMLMMVALQSFAQTNTPLPRIAIAGIGIESSTFSPALSTEASFTIKRGNQIYTSYPGFMHEGSPIRNRATWLPAVTARSLPGGAVPRADYEAMAGYILDSLKKNLPYDGLFFDIHGAMSVVGLDDPEGDLITRVRKVVGPETIISTSMDLHGNVSVRLAELSDLITCYRMAPHEDAQETKQRSVEQLLQRLESGKGKPRYKAWIPVPILLPGEQTSTRIEPAKSLYAAVGTAAARPGVMEAALWMGYPWADEPRNHGVVMVTGDDQEAVAASAEALANHFWQVRDAFHFVAPTGSLAECLNKAIASRKKPFFISDSGDNPTAGGAGDVTWSLQQILAREEFKSANGPTLIYASIPGPDMIQKALKAGVGKKVTGLAGAAVDNRYAPPLLIEGTVRAIYQGDANAGVEAVIQTGSVFVIVTQERKPYHKEADFTRLGLEPRKADIVVVKIGYLEPELYNMRADWLLALTPGGVDQDLARLPYKRIQRPMFPLDKNMKDPDLKVRWVKASQEAELY